MKIFTAGPLPDAMHRGGIAVITPDRHANIARIWADFIGGVEPHPAQPVDPDFGPGMGGILISVWALVVVVSALLAYGRGLVREAMAIIGWVAAAVIAFLFAPRVEPLVREIPVVGEFVADPPTKNVLFI